MCKHLIIYNTQRESPRFVWVYIYMHLYPYIYILYMYTCKNAYMHICMYICVYICIYVYMHVCIYTYILAPGPNHARIDPQKLLSGLEDLLCVCKKHRKLRTETYYDRKICCRHPVCVCSFLYCTVVALLICWVLP